MRHIKKAATYDDGGAWKMIIQKTLSVLPRMSAVSLLLYFIMVISEKKRFFCVCYLRIYSSLKVLKPIAIDDLGYQNSSFKNCLSTQFTKKNVPI